MHKMPTRKSLHWILRCEHKIVAYRAIALQTLLPALVDLKGDVHTCIAGHAMEVVNP